MEVNKLKTIKNNQQVKVNQNTFTFFYHYQKI